MEWVVVALQLGLFIGVYLWFQQLKSYAETKGKNLATREDVAKITSEIERVKLEYAEKLELFKKQILFELEQAKFDLRLRERAVVMAELAAEWLSEKPDAKRMTQLCFESSFWLPPELVRDFTRTLNGQSGAKNIFQLMIDVRRVVAGSDGGLGPQDLIFFPKDMGKGSGQGTP